MRHSQNMVIFHNTFLNLLKAIMNEMHLLDLVPKVLHIENFQEMIIYLTNGYAKLFFTILTFKCLKSVTPLLSCIPFQLINITGLEYSENPSFSIPK